MSEDQTKTSRLTQSKIDRRSSPARGGNSGRVLGLVVIVLFFLIGMAWLFIPADLRNALFQRTSQPENMQSDFNDADEGISTEFETGDEELQETADTSIEVPVGDGLSDADRDRLEQMEAELQSLRSAEGGLTEAEMDSLLEGRLDAMRNELERMMLSQRPVTAGVNSNPDQSEAEARARMEAERQRREEIEASQVASNGLVFDGGGTVGGEAGNGGSSVVPGEMTGDEQFLASASGTDRSYQTVRADRIGNPARTLVQGTILEGVLETAINTDLPGSIRAVLTVDVHSYEGTNVLLPRGTRLIGSYNSDVRIAQRRVQVVWNRAVTPDGTTVEIGSIGSDPLGRSGQTGKVNTHFWQRFGSAALISLVGAAPNALVDQDTDNDIADAIEDLGDDFSDTTQAALDEYLRISPTISVNQGDLITIFVNRDLVF